MRGTLSLIIPFADYMPSLAVGLLPDSFGDESRTEAEQSPVRFKLDLVYV